MKSQMKDHDFEPRRSSGSCDLGLAHEELKVTATLSQGGLTTQGGLQDHATSD